MANALLWQRTYPSLSTAMAASLETVCAWCDNLPAPQSDVERTVLRRLQARRHDLVAADLRKTRPDIVEKFNAILDRMNAAGIRPPSPRL